MHLYLPENYTPDREIPLIVFLHGWVPSTSIIDPWILPDSVLDIAGDLSCMLLIPYGRRNTDFQGVGEVDVLRSIEEIKALYPVDESRIYLNGVSMGGMGAWTIALRHPGIFAATTPMCGQTDMYRWWGWNKDDMAPFKQWMVEWDNPWHIAPSMRAQDFFVQHGEFDTLIPVEQSRIMVEKAEEQRDHGCVELYEYKGSSHYIYFQDEPFEKAFKWQLQYRLDPKPNLVAHKTYSLEYGKAFWASIDQFIEWGKPAVMRLWGEPEIQKQTLSELDIVCENVARINIDIPNSPLADKDEYVVGINNERRTVRREGDRLVVDVVDPPSPEKSFPPMKRKGLCGPCEEVFDTSFIVVQGTAGGPEDDLELEEKVTRFATEWDTFADGFPRVKLDTEITPADIAESNLVLFGRPQTNVILGQIYFRLPVRIGDHRYEVAGNQYQGDDLGLVMCYPNPLNPDKYVLIFAGEYWGEKLDVNHKFDMLPDFIVFTTMAFTREGDTNEHLCAGFFDTNWELSEKTTWVR
jgi:pimeloyl-ACP methyl ester carboxylesterase